MGPGLDPRHQSESFNIMQQFGDGTFRLGVPKLGIGVVDVRDVAHMHCLAAFHPSAQGRYITNGTNSSLLDVANNLRPKFGKDHPLPNREIPNWLAIMAAPFSGLSIEFGRRNFGHEFAVNNAKSQQELGMVYRPLEQTVTEFFQQLVDAERL